MLDDVVADQDDLTAKVEIKANTEDGSAVVADDELWSEGEGTLATIKVYDAEGTLFDTILITA